MRVDELLSGVKSQIAVKVFGLTSHVHRIVTLAISETTDGANVGVCDMCGSEKPLVSDPGIDGGTPILCADCRDSVFQAEMEEADKGFGFDPGGPVGPETDRYPPACDEREQLAFHEVAPGSPAGFAGFAGTIWTGCRLYEQLTGDPVHPRST